MGKWSALRFGCYGYGGRRYQGSKGYGSNLQYSRFGGGFLHPQEEGEEVEYEEVGQPALPKPKSFSVGVSLPTGLKNLYLQKAKAIAKPLAKMLKVYSQSATERAEYKEDVRNTMKDDKGLAAAHKKAQEISKREGVVQHIERNPKTGHHSVSDWYDSDRTVATYNNGKLREEVNESKTASIARGIVMRKLGTMKLLKTPKPAQPKEPEKPTDVKNTVKMTTEELSKKAQIVKKAAQKAKDKFQPDPVITQTYVKTENS